MTGFFESYSLKEIHEFKNRKNPDFWIIETRINPENLRTYYRLEYCIINYDRNVATR